jgi:hypothetical protein
MRIRMATMKNMFSEGQSPEYAESILNPESLLFPYYLYALSLPYSRDP